MEPPALEAKLLGDPSVTRQDGVPVRFPTQRALGLFAYAMGVARCWRGVRRAAAEAFAQGEAAYDDGLHERLLSLGPSDPGLVCIARGAASRFLVSGDPLAAGAIDEAHARAERLAHAHSLNYTLTWKAMQALDAMEWDRAEATIRETIDLAEAQDFPTWKTMGQLMTARFASARLQEAASQRWTGQ